MYLTVNFRIVWLERAIYSLELFVMVWHLDLDEFHGAGDLRGRHDLSRHHLT